MTAYLALRRNHNVIGWLLLGYALSIAGAVSAWVLIEALGPISPLNRGQTAIVLGLLPFAPVALVLARGRKQCDKEVICPHCYESVHPLATRCPHCAGEFDAVPPTPRVGARERRRAEFFATDNERLKSAVQDILELRQVQHGNRPLRNDLFKQLVALGRSVDHATRYALFNVIASAAQNDPRVSPERRAFLIGEIRRAFEIDGEKLPD
jgi:hypothetical protein